MAKPDILSSKITELLATHHLLTVQKMLQHLEADGTPYNKTSVYRSLEKLLSTEKICRHDLSGAEASYELQDDHHDHVVCSSCGKVVAIACKLDKQIRVPGFSIDHHHATFFGRCKDCR